MPSRSQRHAHAVYGQVQALIESEEKLREQYGNLCKESEQAEKLCKELQQREKRRKQYGALCHRFPILVLRCGLAQALGFLQAKATSGDSGNAHGLLLGHLAEQLHGQADGAAFQQQVQRAPLAEYRRLTREALALALWYKRYAESLLGVAAGDEGAKA